MSLVDRQTSSASGSGRFTLRENNPRGRKVTGRIVFVCDDEEKFFSKISGSSGMLRRLV